MLLAGESRLAFDVSRADDGAIAVHSATLHSDGRRPFGERRARGRLRAAQRRPFAEARTGRTRRASLRAGRYLGRGADGECRARCRRGRAMESDDRRARRGGRLRPHGHRRRRRVGAGARILSRPNARGTSFRFEASAAGVAPGDVALRDALGPTFKVTGAGSWSAGRPVAFDNLSVVLTGATANFSGTASGSELSGDFAGKRDRLGALFAASPGAASAVAPS